MYCEQPKAHSIYTSAEDFSKYTEALLKLERDAEIEESRFLIENVSPKLLEKRGVCITKLNIESRKTGLYGRQVITFKPSNVNRRELPATNISSGDIVGLHAKDHATVITSGVVLRVSPIHITVAFEQSDELSGFSDDLQYYVVKLANDVTYKRIKRALHLLESSQRGPSSHLIDVLFAEKGDLSPIDLKQESINYFNTNLDESQRAAVHLVLVQRNLAMVHGPPGTGKTTTVVEAIRQCVSRGLKVLACAPSNVAVDNLVLRLSASKIKVVRLGHPARAMPEIQKYSLDALISASEDTNIVDDVRSDIDKLLKTIRDSRGSANFQSIKTDLKALRQELRRRSDEAVRRILKSSDVVLSTLTSATDDGPLRILEDMHFDIVFIDECSQAIEAACWIALLRAPKAVLAGDHLQLPPTILSQEAARQGLAVTLMERLMKSHSACVQMLTVQYRMHESIMDWASRELYEGKLTAHPSVAEHLLADLPGVEDSQLTRQPLLMIDTSGCDLRELDLPDEQSKGNEGEADLVAIHTEALIDAGLAQKDIAIISPYNLQVELIRNRLSEKYPLLEIKSVDGYQGREKEAVIISLVRSNTKGHVGFLAEDRRLNVAVTRARRHVAIICDASTVGQHAFLKRLVEHLSSRGVVHSAAEYQLDHSVGQTSEKVIELLRSSDCAENRPSLSTDSRRSKVKASGTKLRPISGRKSYLPSADLKSYKDAGCAPPESKEDREARIRLQFTEVISSFCEDQSKLIHKFPASLNSYERLIVHQIAEHFGLLHTSGGEGSERRITLEKQVAPVSKSIASSSQSPTQTSDETDGTTCTVTHETSTTDDASKPAPPNAQKEKARANRNKGKGGTRHSAFKHKDTVCIPVTETFTNEAVEHLDAVYIPEKVDKHAQVVGDDRIDGLVIPSSLQHAETTTTVCAICKRSLPRANFHLHRMHCEKLMKSAGPDPAEIRKGDQQTKANKKGKTSTKDAIQILSAVDAEDFDALVAAAADLNGVCNYTKCKALVRTLGVNCPHCCHRFCLTHSMPEIHGCGEMAKQEARALISREGRLYNGSGVPNKKPSAEKRAQLERKLNKKMADLTDQRKPKSDRK